MRKSKILLLDIAVHLLFAGLFILAYIFYKERLFTDSAYYIYNVIDHESFWLQLKRFVQLFSQYLPLLAIKFGFSLKNILIIYSVGNVIFFYMLYLISRFYYKEFYAGILLVLIQTIGIMSGFFTPMFELFYSAGFLVLFDIILNKESNKRFDLILLIILGFIIITGHPYAYFLLPFIFLLHYYKNNWKYQKKYNLFILLIVLGFLFKCLTVDDYEQGKVTAFAANLFKDYDFKYILLLIKFLFQYYADLLVLAVFSLLYFIIKKEYMMLAFCGGMYLLLLAMVNVSYYGFEHSRYQEQVYFPLSFIVSYTFVRFILNNLRPNLWIASFLLAIALVSVRFVRIYNDGINFSHRITKMEQLIQHCQTLPGNKFVIRKYNIMHENSIDPNWSYPIETMLLSGINPKNKTVTICTDEDMDYNHNATKISPAYYLHRKWELYEDKKVNKKYFQITNSKYRCLNNYCLLPKNSISIEIKANNNIKVMQCKSHVFYNILLINKNESVICSDSMNNILLSYYWIKDENVISKNELRTPIMADINKSLAQDMIIATPEKPGKYVLAIDILIDNKKCRMDCKVYMEIE